MLRFFTVSWICLLLINTSLYAEDNKSEARVKAALVLAKATLKDQATKPYCLCWIRGEECTCDVCTCPGGRKFFTTTDGRQVEFKRDGDKWVPNEPGWRIEGGYWIRDAQLPPQTFFQPMPTFFGSSGISRGGSC